MSRKICVLALGALLATLLSAQRGSAAEPAALETEPLTEVTVTARHFALEQRVSKFVYQIAALQNAQGIARWRLAVCPMVAGLPKDEGEFMLGRLSEIARAAGAPLAGESCQPNLFIVVTPDPALLLQGMTRKTELLIFGTAHPNVVADFIDAARPVKSWYRTYEAGPDGQPLTHDGTALGDAYPILLGRLGRVAAQTAHAQINLRWNFKRVLVIVDQRRLAAVTRGQLADYAGMVGLAQVNPDGPLGDAPTILKLFDGDPRDAPQGMSEWDAAFLKSVYSTSQASKGQREQIAQTVLHDIAH